MRPIKFRAWCNFDGSNQMFGWDELLRLEALPNILCGDAVAELMQFTGLTDKNGKEIYEGDIVLFDSGNSLDGKWVVVWSFFDAGWRRQRIGDNRLTFWVSSEQRVCRVIGNIYENKELLDG